MIDWDAMPWARLTDEELERLEELLAEHVLWLLESRHAEQLLTGQEP